MVLSSAACFYPHVTRLIGPSYEGMFMVRPGNGPPSLLRITPVEVGKAARNLAAEKATGPDGFPASRL